MPTARLDAIMVYSFPSLSLSLISENKCFGAHVIASLSQIYRFDLIQIFVLIPLSVFYQRSSSLLPTNPTSGVSIGFASICLHWVPQGGPNKCIPSYILYHLRFLTPRSKIYSVLFASSMPASFLPGRGRSSMHPLRGIAKE